MELDDELCLCFHVSRRKIANFIRIERPQRVSQISQCGGAGTGCGWCRPFLERLFKQAAEPVDADSLPSAESYANDRQDYIQAGHGRPPGDP